MAKNSKAKVDKYEKISRLARRRGFFWFSSEIYGGVGGFIDLGPLGVQMKLKIMDKWRKFFVKRHQDFIVEIETPIVMPERVFQASGHLDHFTDYIVECLSCHRKFRADHLLEETLGLEGLEKLSESDLDELIRANNVRCPECNGLLGNVQKFNLLFKTTIGPYTENVGYARPEAAQGMFTAFMRVYEAMRRRLPLGIAQLGKVLRNEISPRQGPIRLREFTIMELELFYDPKNPQCELLSEVSDVELRLLTEEMVARGIKEPLVESVREAVERGHIINEWNAYFMALAKLFINELGVPDDKQMFVAKLPEERAHYAAQTYDQVVWTERWGWVEVSGHAYRTDYDLRRHMKFSGQDLRAYRLLKEPIVKRKLVVKINKSLIGRTFKKRTRDIMSCLEALSQEEIVDKLEKYGYIEVTGERLGKEYFNISYVEERVSTERFIPHVAEPSFGAERCLYVTLEYSYSERDSRVVLSIPRDLSPIEVAVFPLVTSDELVSKAKETYELLKSKGFTVIYDEEGSIGRRYVRVDEIGVPFSVTIDGQSISDNTATVRDRDTWRQVRLKISEIPEFIELGIENPQKNFEELIKEFCSSRELILS